MPQLETALFELGGIDDFARRQSPVHRLDSRAKVVVALAFIVTDVSFGKYEIAGLIPLVAYPVVMIAMGGIPARWLMRKMIWVAPIAIMIGIANPILDRAILVEAGPIKISGGWTSFASIVLRFALTFSAALILISTTGFDSVCAALRRFKVPRVMTMQLMLLYRYIFVLAEEAARMMRAWSLRSVNVRRISLREFGSLLGQLLLRALDRAQRVHQAMLCRGFDGELRGGAAMNFGAADTGFVLGWIAFFFVARIYDLPHVMGRIAMGLFH